jgi:hypothetical protein
VRRERGEEERMRKRAEEREDIRVKLCRICRGRGEVFFLL